MLFLIALLSIALPVHAGRAFEEKGWKPTAIPLLNFSSDHGTGYGLRASLFRYDGSTIPYARALSAQAFFTTRGKWSHRLYLDLPQWRPGQRLEAEAFIEKEDFANYYGDLSDAQAEALLGAMDEKTREQRTTFRQVYPKLRLMWVRALGAPWHLRAGFQAGHNQITPNSNQGSLLQLLDPLGRRGGFLLLANASLRRDTRDDYNDSSRGVLEELLVEYGLGRGGHFNGGRLSIEHRHFLPLPAGLVLAHRANAALAFGDLPFYEELKLGGDDTVRGVAAARERGEGRLLFNGTALAGTFPGAAPPHPRRPDPLCRRRPDLPAGGWPIPGRLAPGRRRRGALLLAEYHCPRRCGQVRQADRDLSDLFPGVLMDNPLDIHVHLVGNGTGDTGCWLRLRGGRRLFARLMLRHIGLPQSALRGDLDRLYVERLLQLIRASSLGQAVLLAHDQVYDGQGHLIEGAGIFHVPNDYVLSLARQHPEFLAGVSIHPARPDALQELERCLEGGAVLMKCLPNVQNIDCSDRRHTRFWERMAEAGLPLLAHTGGEHTLPVLRPEFADPRTLELPLQCGVIVIAAHCATQSGLKGPDYFPLFADMLRRYPRLYGDISAFNVPIRGRVIPACLQAPIAERLVHGSDFPVPVSGLWAWQRGFIDWRTFRRWEKHHNPIERDLRLKRAMGFPPATFTRARGILRLPVLQP